MDLTPRIAKYPAATVDPVILAAPSFELAILADGVVAVVTMTAA